MLRVIVMNAKGGCGKTTVATNLASFAAAAGRRPALFDYDPQGSSTRWLEFRPKELAAIHGVAAYAPPAPGTTRSFQLRVPAETELMIKDTPAGFAGIDFEDRVSEADVILVPVLPSAIDIHSTADFIRDLLLKGRVRAHNKRLGIIANRLRANTLALNKLEHFLDDLKIPVVARLRDTQNYVQAVEQGMGVHELVGRKIRRDTGPWQGLLDWLGQDGAVQATAKSL